jgi:hypothetical protein
MDDLGTLLKRVAALERAVQALSAGEHVHEYIPADLRIGGGLCVGNTATDPAADTIVCDGSVYIGDTANANSMLGLTVNQGANDDEILSLKSSDVAHGMTSLTETDTWSYKKKVHATNGGAIFAGFSAATVATQIYGAGVTDNTTKTTAGRGYIELLAMKKNGTAASNCGADANLVVFRDYDTTKVIFDKEGENHTDVAWSTFDEHDDLALIDDVERAMLPQRFGETLEYHRADLEKLGIAHFDDRPGHAMVNWTRLNMLQVGALRTLAAYHREDMEIIKQQGGTIKQLSSQLDKFNRALLSLGADPKLLLEE